MRAAHTPELAARVLALFEYAKVRGSRQTFGRGKSPSATAWLGEHEDDEWDNPIALRFGDENVSVLMKNFRSRRGPEEMERLVSLLRQLPGTSDALDDAVAKDYRTYCRFPVDRVLATDADLEAFKRVLDEAVVRTLTAG